MQKLYPIQSTFNWPNEYKIYESITTKQDILNVLPKHDVTHGVKTLYREKPKKYYPTVRSMQKAVHIPRLPKKELEKIIAKVRKKYPQQLTLPGYKI